MSARTLFAIWAVAITLAGLWTLAAGKDLNWDLLHYHFYDAYALLHGRLAQDYFAASTQSYLNPIGYVPFYLMVAAGWHSAIVSLVLAAAHGASLALLFLIGWTLFAHHSPGKRWLASLLAAAIGAATAVYWTTVGTSFLDPLLAVPMLAGTLLMLGARPESAIRRSAWAGLAFGVAAALKYSNAFFALAGLLLAATVPAATLAARMRALLAYAAGGALSTALFAGPWMAAMYREFGNPVFPHLNAWFRSPAFPPFNLAAGRYAPQGLLEALAFPFQMVSHSSLTYTEIAAPDMRFSVLAACTVALIAMVAVRRGRAPGSAALRLVDLRLFGFFALSLALWIWTSANGRYGLLVLLLAGPCLARLFDRTLPFRFAAMAMVLTVAMQAVASVTVSTPRWFITERWTSEWFAFSVPERAKDRPALYLSVEAQAMGSVIPFLNPGSSFVNLRGQYSLAAGNERLLALLARHDGNVRVLGRGLRPGPKGAVREDVIELYDGTLLRFGYRIDPQDCFVIGWSPRSDDWLSHAANLLSMESAGRDRVLSMGSCGLRKAARDPAEVAEERRMSEIFDRIERSCRRLFRDQSSVTDRLGKEWSRDYVGLEARMETQSGYVVLVPYFKLRYVNLGTLAAWEQPAAEPPPPCRDDSGASR